MAIQRLLPFQREFRAPEGRGGSMPPRLPEIFATGGRRYIRGKRLGAGGMGEVFLGKNETGATVILKYINVSEFINALTAEGFINYILRFLEEYDLARRVKHDNIATAIDTNIRDAIPGVDGLKNLLRPDVPEHIKAGVRNSFTPQKMAGKDIFIVYEFVAKEPGSAKAAPPVSECFIDRVSPAVIKMFFVPVLEALTALHAENIAHRDLKPDNLLVTQIDIEIYGEIHRVPVVKIIDFGIGKDTDSKRKTEFTTFGSIVGTPQYLPAYSYISAAQTDKSVYLLFDIYAMGEIFYELMTASNPFAGIESPAQMFQAKTDLAGFNFARIENEPARAIVRKMLSPYHKDNYQSMREVIAAWQSI